MNTRFKVLSVVVIYIISVLILYILFSSTGYYANREMKKTLILLEEEIEQKESDVNLLSKRAESEKIDETRESALVYSFDNDIFDPLSERTKGGVTGEIIVLSLLECLIIGGFISIVYALIIALVIPHIVNKRRKNGRDN